MSLYVLQHDKFNYIGKCDCGLFSNAVTKTVPYCVKLLDEKKLRNGEDVEESRLGIV
jgi:hypothetical protein